MYMKKLLLSVLACGMFASSFAQHDPIEPCCNIISTDIKNNTVVARDKTTGRLYQFKADALDMKAVNVNDAVNVASGKVTAIGGAKRMYVAMRPDPISPCCNVVKIQPDPLEPCCNLVTYMNNSNNQNNSISVPKQIASTLKVGQGVSIFESNGMAVIQSNSNGQMNSYGYPVSS